MAWWERFREQFGKVWENMGTGRRVSLVLLVVVCLGLMIGVFIWSSRPDYRILYRDLNPEDSGAITAALQNQGVPYKLEAGGGTILVAADRLDQARIQLAVEGLPAKSGKGFELFDQTSLGQTPFTQHINYLRALQAELARTIMQVDGVLYARVHIVNPDPSPFVREQKPTTASVMLRLRPNGNLSPSVAAGIASLVARSVEGLTLENVTLIDDRGRVLTESQNETGAASSQLEYRRSVEQYLAAKSEEMLNRVLGPGRAIVRVAVDINFQRLKDRKEMYWPDGRVVIDEKTTTSKSSSGANGARGPVGAVANVPNRAAGTGITGASAGQNTQEETTETRFVVSKTIQELEDRMASVERITVAAMVDLGKGEANEVSLPLADIQDLIKQAMGFRPNRDQIKVTEVKLSTPSFENVDLQVEKIEWLQTFARVAQHASLAVVAVVVFLLVLMILRRLTPPTPAVSQERQQLLEKLSSAARTNPQALAQVLSAMLQKKPAVKT